MPDKLTMTLGAKAAMHKSVDIKATVDVEVKVTRAYFWIIKLRTIWAVIRVPMGKR